MPIPPANLQHIQSIRKFISSGVAAGASDRGLHLLIHKLFENPDKIVSDAETLDAILALAVEFEAYRGKGSQYGIKEFYQRLSGLYYHAPIDPPEPEKRDGKFPAEVTGPPSPASAIPWFEKLSGYFFQRVQGPPVRSQRAGYLRRMAWDSLGDLSGLARHPEHLAHAHKVAADTRAAEEEREGAVMFMSEYWAGEEPDQATAELLWKLEKNPPSRGFLVTVLQAQIELDLNNEFGALVAVDDWDDAEEEE